MVLLAVKVVRTKMNLFFLGPDKIRAKIIKEERYKIINNA
jgi:hypothetical protein